MQQAVGLLGALLDHHARGQGIVVEAFTPDVRQFTDGVFLDLVELVDLLLGAATGSWGLSLLVLFRP